MRPPLVSLARSCWLIPLVAAIGCQWGGSPTPIQHVGRQTQPATSPSLPSAHEPSSVRPHIYNRVVAFCVGIDRYQSAGIPDLNHAEADARTFAETVHRLYGYDPVLLLGKAATREAFSAKLREVSEQLGERDVLILYFAGHGQVVERPSHGRDGFLIPYDARLDLKTDRTRSDIWSNEAIDMHRLVAQIDGMRAHHVVLIADACCSGFMTKRGTGFAGRPDYHMLLTEPSRTVLAASTE